MDFFPVARRSLLAFLVVAISSGLVVYLLNDWFSQQFLPSLGLGTPLGSAFGTVLVVATAYLGQRAVSFAFYRDMVFGLANRDKDILSKVCGLEDVSSEVAKELQGIRNFNDVLRQQLQNIVDETEKAAMSITERLLATDAVITRLNNFVTETSLASSAVAADSEAHLKENHQAIARMESYITTRIEEARNDQKRIEQVANEAQALGSLVQLIRHISGQTNLLALNAAIEAARAGEAGRGFAVVADQVRKLSSETDSAVTRINDGINSVADTIRTQFEDKLSNANVEQEQLALHRFAEHLSELNQNYHRLVQDDLTVMASLRESSSALAAMFMDILASIQFQDITRQQIELVRRALDRLDDHTALLAQRLIDSEGNEFHFTPLAEHLDHIYQSYVMDQQRLSHRQALQQPGAGPLSAEASAPPAKIELF